MRNMSDQISKEMAMKLASIAAALSQASSEYVRREIEDILDAWCADGLNKVKLRLPLYKA